MLYNNKLFALKNIANSLHNHLVKRFVYIYISKNPNRQIAYDINTKKTEQNYSCIIYLQKRQPLTTEQTNSSTTNRRTRTLRHTRPRTTTTVTTTETPAIRNSYKVRGGSRSLTSSTLSSANKATSRPSSKATTTDRGDSKSNKRQKTTHHQPTTVQVIILILMMREIEGILTRC